VPAHQISEQYWEKATMLNSRIAAVLLVCVSACAANAQQPATPPSPTPQAPAGGTPDQIPFDIPYGAPIELDRAKQVLAAAEAEAKKRNWKMNIAVVDPNGDLIYFARMDGAMLPSIDISQGKARTAARWRRESRLFYNAMEAGRSFLPTVDKTLVANPGGYPLIENGKIIGGIGCSGGTGDQDAVKRGRSN
jgi:glc operon protein GlcG